MYDNTLYIVDINNNRIVIIGTNSTTAIAIIQNGSDSSSIFSYPTDVFVTQKYIYSLDMLNNHVVRLFKNKTNPVTIVGIDGVSEDNLNTSTIDLGVYLLVDNDENLYVSDSSNDIVIRYPSNTTSSIPGLIDWNMETAEFW
ncbi:unnamed protein product [Rotaria sp. Silwood1]|nr:unnamed protein product [Rotaria sp. Silwood1]